MHPERAMNTAAEAWTGRVGFILATVGSAVGLGSIWKFPYEVGAHGGSAFVLCYLAGLVLIVVPLMFAEFAIGRRGGGDPVASITHLAVAHHTSRRWAVAGALGVLTSFLILSFYAVIGGWTLSFAVETALNGLPAATPQAAKARFDVLLASPATMLAFHALFMAATAVVVARGVAHGIEAASKVLMPLLAVLMLVLAAYSMIEGDLGGALRFLFSLDTKHLTMRTALEAVGLGFFSIGVGMGIMITYAAYGGPGIDLKQVAIVSVVGDTAISLLAGFAVFPIVFANGLDPASGPGLVFVTLPLAFTRMPFGFAAALAFYVLLFVAALASAISLLEIVVAFLVRRFGWGRVRATLVAGATCFGAGLATVLSFNVWANWFPLAAIPSQASATVFDLLDQLTSNLMLPIGGFAIALFAGRVLPAQVLAEELGLGPRGTKLLRVTLRVVAPAGIVAATVGPLFVR